MNLKRLIFILIFLTYGLPTRAQTVTSNIQSKNARVIQAYGYLMEQEYSLNKIKNEFPAFESDVAKTQISFNSTFGKSKQNLSNYIVDKLGSVKLASINSQSRMVVGLVVLSEDGAFKFLNEVDKRSKGNIPSPILETLLSFQFLNQPLEEIRMGYYYTFQTKNHPKAKNTDWLIKVPKSWRASEADTPNLIQQFLSDYGDGNHSIFLMVKDLNLPKGSTLSQEEINDFFTEKQMMNIVPKGGKLVSFSKMNLDNNLGGMLQIEQTHDRLDLKVRMLTTQFMFIRGSKFYTLQCGLGSLEPTIDLNSEMQKYLPFYRYIANSLVLRDQYK